MKKIMFNDRFGLTDAELADARIMIQQRILDIERTLLGNEVEKTCTALEGGAIDGEDYVKKHGCVRETEPEHYDPLNMIIINGRAYCLTDKIRKKDNGTLRHPCECCKLAHECPGDSLATLCNLFNSNSQQYYEKVGIAKYSPSFGTIEVVDEYKEALLDLKRLKVEEEGEDV